METGTIIRCQISGIQPYGVFVNCHGTQGLIHISEISDFYIHNIESIFKVDAWLDCFVMGEEDQKLKLSFKKAYPVSPSISKQIKIISGFYTLDQSLPFFIEKATKK